MIKRYSIWFVFALLTSCGFHLRGMVDMPPWLHHIAIVVHNAHRDLGPLLRDQLQAYNIDVYADSAQAEYWLVIEKDNYHQQITNVSASTTPRQYQLIYDVQFTFLEPKGRVIIPSSHVIVTRQLTVNNDRILGSNSEELILKSEMRREAAMQIINRLSQKK